MTMQIHSGADSQSEGVKSLRSAMKTLLAGLMAMNAGLFFYCAVLHAGVAIGPFHEPRIVPATIVEALCGFSRL